MSHPLQIEIHILLKVHQVCSEYWYSMYGMVDQKYLALFVCHHFYSVTLFVWCASVWSIVVSSVKVGSTYSPLLKVICLFV